MSDEKNNFGPHRQWKGRAVLWVVRDGVLHVASHAATLGRGIVSKLLCGGASTFFPEGDTWYSMKRQGYRFCRKCIWELSLDEELARTKRRS